MPNERDYNEFSLFYTRSLVNYVSGKIVIDMTRNF